jgi:signal transduction histidine kinase
VTPCLKADDTGEGMDADTLARVTELFFTAEEIVNGTGLGLSSTWHDRTARLATGWS